MKSSLHLSKTPVGKTLTSGFKKWRKWQEPEQERYAPLAADRYWKSDKGKRDSSRETRLGKMMKDKMISQKREGLALLQVASAEAMRTGGGRRKIG